MRNKSVSSFVCQECGYDTPKFYGKCPECGAWNSFKEIQIINHKSLASRRSGQITTKQLENITPKTLFEVTSKGDVQNDISKRLSTGFSEVDTVLGGGIVKGSVSLLAGDPGVGKSTLLLQMALNISKDKSVVLGNEKDSINKGKDAKSEILHSADSNNKIVLYISGEESEEQIGLRAKRLAKEFSQNFLLLSLTNTDAVLEIVEKIKPQLVIIDSIQTFESENLEGLSGSVGQVRYATSIFIRIAKTLGIPFIIVGHVTKEGMVAGPMVLSHMVDTVLFLEGDRNTGTRILRSFKNRFGPVDEVGIFAMEQGGMEEVKNPQSLFVTNNQKKVPGSVLVVTMEGTRAFIVEIQALIVFSRLPIPRRVSSGIDQKRLELLLAILQKHVNLPIGTMDVFVNVAGGIKLSDPACDLGICLALYSSFKNIPLSKTVGIAEVGLLGELRNISFLEKRTKEAQKLGFTNIISSSNFKYIGEVIRSIK